MRPVGNLEIKLADGIMEYRELIINRNSNQSYYKRRVLELLKEF